MKKYGIIATVIAIVAIAGFAGLKLLKSDDSMASSLPADVTMVGRVDLKAMVKDYGMTLDELKALVFDKEQKETGIDYLATAYVFAAQERFGAILPLSSEEQFKAFLEENGLTITEQRGLKWSVVDGNILLVYNDNRAMAMGPAIGSDQDQLRNTLAECMTQKESNSGKKSRMYKLLDARKEAVAVAANAELLKSFYDNVNFDFLNACDLTAGLVLKKNKVGLSLAASTEDKNVQKYFDKCDDVFDHIEGDLLPTTPVNPLFHLAMNVDGEELLGLLRENPEVRTWLVGLNTILDMDMILKSIDGDVALTCPTFNFVETNILLQAELDDKDFMKNVADWNDEVSGKAGVFFYPKDKNNATCVFNGQTFYFGTEGDRLSISNSETLTRATSYSGNEWKAQAADMKKCCLYACLEISNLSTLLKAVPYGQSLSAFERLTLSAPTTHELTLELVAPEGTDILKNLIEQ